MPTIHSENWDAVTPPAIPAGWTVDTQIATSTTGAISSPNALDYLAASINNTIVPFATWATLDGNSGNVIVSCSVNFAATANQQEYYLFARSNVVTANANYNTSSRYYISIIRNTASAGFSLAKFVSGTPTTLVGPIGAVAAATNYRAKLTCNGSTITGQIQRLSDSTWLNASGSFVTDATGATAFATVTDTSITGAGYSGLGFYLATASNTIVTDDFLLESPVVPVVDTTIGTKVFYGGSISY